MIPGSTESKATPNDCSPKTASSHHSNAHSAPGSTPGSRAPAPSPSAPCIGPWSSPKSCAKAASTPSSATPRSWAARSSAEQLGEDLREYLKQDIGRGQARAAPTYAPTSCSAIYRSRRAAGLASSPPTRSPRATPARSASIRWSIWGGRSTEPRSRSAGPERRRWRWRCSGQDIRESRSERILDGSRVTGITPSLDPQSRMSGNPYRLAANAGQSFHGSLHPGNWLHPGARGSAGLDREGSAEQGGPVPVPQR